MRSAIREELHRLTDGLELLPAATFVIAGLSLCVYHFYGDYAFFDAHLRALLPRMPQAYAELARCLYWCFSPFISLVLLPHATVAAIARWRGIPRSPTGWRLGDWRLGGAACALFYLVAVVGVVIASRDPDFRSTYPLCDEARRGPGFLAAYEVSIAIYFLAWESFFRGFLTLGLESALGKWTLFVQMLPFVAMHFDKPDLEAMSSVFGGLALGYLALRTRSFVYGALVHAGMATTLDLIVMASRGFTH